jgi:hypothetical protein
MAAPASANIPAAELALMADDQPILIGQNWLRVITTTADARWSATKDIGGADVTDSDYPASRAFDEFSHLDTRVNAGATSRFLCFDLGATAREVDCVIIMGHILKDFTGTVKVHFSTAADFTDSVQVATSTPGNNNKLVFLVLESGEGTAQRYTDARYIALEMTSGSSSLFRASEVIVGRRRQLKRGPLEGYDKFHLRSEVDTFRSASGVSTHYVKYENQRIFRATFRAHETSYVSDLETFWETDTVGGTKNFWWIEEPTTSPNDAVWYHPEPELTGAAIGPHERLFNIAAREQGPDFLTEEA